MFLLKKLFQARQKVAESRSKWDDTEKPFLDHLEDLRKMLVKMAVTLIVAMLACFVFDKELLEIVRYPVVLAGVEFLDGSKLPEGIPEADWGTVKNLSRAVVMLPDGVRAEFKRHIPPQLSDAVEATILFRAALALPEKERAGFLAAAAPPGRVKDLALFLALNNPNAHIDDSNQLLRMTALGPAETFTLTLRLSFMAGIIISFPLLLWFIAEFIMPGLTPSERKMILPSVLLGFVLFLIGVVFAYFVVAPRALRFFFDYSMRLGVISDWRIGTFVSFVTQFVLIFGLCFELPVVVMALVKLGILGYKMMSKTRDYAIVTIFVVAAIITPTTDALTLFLLAGPMIALYEICIWLAWYLERKASREEAAGEMAWKARQLVPAAAGTVIPDDGPTAHDPLPGAREPEALAVHPAPDTVPQLDPDDLPNDWGETDDPYGLCSTGQNLDDRDKPDSSSETDGHRGDPKP